MLFNYFIKTVSILLLVSNHLIHKQLRRFVQITHIIESHRNIHLKCEICVFLRDLLGCFHLCRVLYVGGEEGLSLGMFRMEKQLFLKESSMRCVSSAHCARFLYAWVTEWCNICQNVQPESSVWNTVSHNAMRWTWHFILINEQEQYETRSLLASLFDRTVKKKVTRFLDEIGLNMQNNWIYLWDDNWMVLDELNKGIMSKYDSNVVVFKCYTLETEKNNMCQKSVINNNNKRQRNRKLLMKLFFCFLKSQFRITT